MKETKVKGRIWLIHDESGKLIDNIDTDMIFHNSHLHITDLKDMGQHTFGNLKGWKDFPKRASRGDIVVAGSNFGAGSSRQQAVDCFSSLGITAIVAESYGAIYKRNALNSGLPILSCPDIKSIPFENGQQIEFDFETGEIKSSIGNVIGRTLPMSEVQLAIYSAGGIFNYAKGLK